jgi:hypothetical protein
MWFQSISGLRMGLRISGGNRTNLELVLQIHGVGDGVRTRDVQIHSLALYQLSYTHRVE